MDTVGRDEGLSDLTPRYAGQQIGQRPALQHAGESQMQFHGGTMKSTRRALPGAAALQAALHPATSKALYFVARGDGTSQFSESLEQHNQAVDHYIRGKGNPNRKK